MLRLIAHRLLLALPLLFAVSALTFVLTALAPGDAASALLGESATPAKIAALQRQLGLDHPIYVQYWDWLEHAVRGDLGDSIVTNQSVTSALTARLPVTLSLAFGATILSALLGVSLGVFSGIKGGALGGATDVLAMLGFAIPGFWLGLVLVSVLAVNAGLLPATGFVPFSESPADWLRSLILPWFTLALVGVTGIARQTRAAMREVMGRDFIMALRADGVAESRIIFDHGLRNAAIPVVTMVGTFFVAMLGGTVLVESVFAMNGLGSLAVSSAQNGDLTMLQGIAVVYAVIVVVVNILIDIAYGALNPKARLA